MSGEHRMETRPVSSLSPLAQGLDHPEGVAWGPDGRVYAGGEAGQIYRIDLSGKFECYANTGGILLGMALDSQANLYACDLQRKEVVRVTPTGKVSTYASGDAQLHMTLPNYPVFDALGNLYVSDSGDWGGRNGLIWRVRPGGEAEVWDRQASGFTNGMCLDATGRWLYVVESSPPLVSRVQILSNGSAGRREVVAEIPRTVPDGVAFDVEGKLFISLYNPNIIYCFSEGRLNVVYDDWEQLVLMAPTNIAFGGAELKTLLIANLAGTNLATAQMSVPGLALRYPKVHA